MDPISTKDYIWINTIGEKQTASNHPIVQKSNKRSKVTSTKVPYDILFSKNLHALIKGKPF